METYIVSSFSNTDDRMGRSETIKVKDSRSPSVPLELDSYVLVELYGATFKLTHMKHKASK